MDLPALAIHKSRAPEPKGIRGRGHNPGSEEHNTGWSNQEPHKSRNQDSKSSHFRSWTGYCKALFGGRCGKYSACLLTLVPYAHVSAIAQSWTQDLTMAPYASVSPFFQSWICVFAMTAMIACADARALPLYHLAQVGSGSDAAVSSDDLGKVSPLNREPSPGTHGTDWSLWANLAIASVSVLGGVEAWATSMGERVRRIRDMGYVCVFTLAIAATPMVLHQTGGIDAEVKGPLLALWAGGHLNFLLRGAILVRHEQAGYGSPLGYLGVLAVLSHLIFSAADKQNSRLYATLTTLAVTILWDVGLRASFGDP
jgi:hypothetical protein